MTLSTKKPTLYRRSAPFRKYQIGRLSARRPGIALIKVNINVAKQSQRKVVNIDDSIDDDSRRSENFNQLFEGYETRGENKSTSSVKDIINYFERKRGSADKNLEVGTPQRTSATKASAEIKAPDRRWNGASSCESSQTFIDDRASVSAEGSSSNYEYSSHDNCESAPFKMEPLEAQRFDISRENLTSLYEAGSSVRRLDQRSLAIPDDGLLLSQKDSELSSRTSSTAFYTHSSTYSDQDFDAYKDQLAFFKEHEGLSKLNKNDIAFSHVDEFEFTLRRHDLLAYENKLRVKSASTQHMPSNNIIQTEAGLTDVEISCERQIQLDGQLNRRVDQNFAAVDDSFISPQRRGASDHLNLIQARQDDVHLKDLVESTTTVDQRTLAPVDDSFIAPQRLRATAANIIAHAQEDVHKVLEETTSQHKHSRAMEQIASSDSFIIPERSVQAERIWNSNLDIDAAESTAICIHSPQSVPNLYAERKQKYEEHSPAYNCDELAMMPDRSLGNGNLMSDRPFMYPVDCDVNLMDRIESDSQQSSERQKADSNESTREQRKVSPALGLKRATKTPDRTQGTQKELGKVKSQLPGASRSTVRASSKVTDHASTRGLSHVDQARKGKEEAARKRVADMRLKRDQRNAAKTNTASANKSSNVAKLSSKSPDSSIICRASTLPSLTPPSSLKKSTGVKHSGILSPNLGELGLSRRDASTNSALSSVVDSQNVNARIKQRSQITVVNPRIAAAKPPRSNSVPVCSREPAIKGNGKPLQSRSRSAIPTHLNTPTPLSPNLQKLKI